MLTSSEHTKTYRNTYQLFPHGVLTHTELSRHPEESVFIIGLYFNHLILCSLGYQLSTGKLRYINSSLLHIDGSISSAVFMVLILQKQLQSFQPYLILISAATLEVIAVVPVPVLTAVSPTSPSTVVVVVVILVVLPASSEVGDAMMETGRSWTSG